MCVTNAYETQLVMAEVKLNLKRPLIFFDVETTGLDIIKDRIVEISVVKVFPDGHEEIKTKRINPEMPIPAQSSAIHGIKDEDVKDAPTFKQIAKSLVAFIEGCDIAGYNSTQFDIPILEEEFLRSGISFDFSKHYMIDVQAIFHKMEKRTLAAAYQFYCNKTLEDAHSAQADTIATYEVLKAQLAKYEGQIENDMEKLAQFTSNNRIDYAGRIVKNEKGGQDEAGHGRHQGV